MNKKIRELEDVLIEALNASDVPHEIKRLICQNLLNAETKLADAEIIKEIEEENAKNV